MRGEFGRMEQLAAMLKAFDSSAFHPTLPIFLKGLERPMHLERMASENDEIFPLKRIRKAVEERWDISCRTALDSIAAVVHAVGANSMATNDAESEEQG